MRTQCVYLLTFNRRRSLPLTLTEALLLPELQHSGSKGHRPPPYKSRGRLFTGENVARVCCIIQAAFKLTTTYEEKTNALYLFMCVIIQYTINYDSRYVTLCNQLQNASYKKL